MSGSGDDAAKGAGAPASVDTGRLFRSDGAEGDTAVEAIPARRHRAEQRRAASGRAERRRDTGPSAPDGGADPDESTGLSAAAAWLVVVGVTVLLGVADMIAVTPGSIGWLTGAGLLLSSAYCAALISRRDRWTAVIAPPLAFLAATLIAGQLGLPPSGTLLVREALMVFTTLSVNVVWIVGSTALAAAIVAIRARRP